MTARPLVVAFDCDGVLTDTIRHFLKGQVPAKDVFEKLQELESYDDVTKKYGLSNLYNWLEANVSHLPPVPSAEPTLARLRALRYYGSPRVRVVCVTAPPPLCVVPSYFERRRREWLVKTLGFAERDIIFAPSDAKQLIDCDVFVEGNFSTVIQWNAGHRQGFMVAHPWNSAPFMRSGPHKVIEFHDLGVVADYVEKVLSK